MILMFVMQLTLILLAVSAREELVIHRFGPASGIEIWESHPGMWSEDYRLS